MSKVFCSFLILIIFLGCNHKKPGMLSEEDKELVQMAVKERVDAYFIVARQQNIDTMLGFWADSDSFVFAADGNIVIGYAGFSGQMPNVAQMTDSVLSLEKYNEHIFVLSSHAATSTLQFKGTSTLITGDAIRSRGSWTYVFSQMNNEWKVIHSAGTHIYF